MGKLCTGPLEIPQVENAGGTLQRHRGAGAPDLQQFEEHALDVLSHVAGLCQRGCVCLCEGNPHDATERLRQQRLAAASGALHAQSWLVM